MQLGQSTGCMGEGLLLFGEQQVTTTLFKKIMYSFDIISAPDLNMSQLRIGSITSCYRLQALVDISWTVECHVKSCLYRVSYNQEKINSASYLPFNNLESNYDIKTLSPDVM